MSIISLRPNALGENIAENDSANLASTFIETPEYRSILETNDRCVVVGRRGTGKSAMFWKLDKYWADQKSSHVIKIAPEDDQTIYFRGLFSKFNGNYSHIRAVAKIIWKYSFLMEMLSHLSKSYKSKELLIQNHLISDHVKKWGNENSSTLTKAAKRIHPLIKSNDTIENIIGSLSTTLELRYIEDNFRSYLEISKINFYILIDKLDEGFENDETGAAIISGAVTSTSDLNKKYDNIRAVLFLRDNINRSIARHDPDYTRNIEGEIIRLHWDQYQLLNLVSRRLDKIFNLNIQNDQKIWDKCSADEGVGRELRGKDGFRKCLQFTLFRPRDLLLLLNTAYYQAYKERRNNIVLKDIEYSAKIISESRLHDLEKEYFKIFPSIAKAIRCFTNKSPEMSCEDAIQSLDDLSISGWENDSSAKQDFLILKNAGVLKALYSVGFLGMHDTVSDTFIFCHDGGSPDKEFTPVDRLLIHPCYWISLNLNRNALTMSEAEQINDEYEIKITSQTPEIRANRIGAIISSLGNINEGREDAEDFELWVENAIQTVFAGHLDNFERKANANAIQRRDLIATNLSRTPCFDRIFKDYGSRQIVFEIKNFRDIGSDEYRQMSTYLHNQYGSMGFIITRDDEDNLHAGKELDWVKEIYHIQKKLIIRITAKFLQKLLSKLRSPEKHDAVDKAITALLNQYERTYLSLQSTTGRKKK